MKVKDLAEKINKPVEDVKRMLQELGAPVRNITSVVDPALAAKLIEKYTAPKAPPKMIRIIKKADLAQVLTKTEDGLDISAGQKAFQVMAQEKQKKEEDEKPVIVEKKTEIKAEKVELATAPIAAVVIDPKTGVVIPIVPLKEDTHKKDIKDKDKVFRQEKTFKHANKEGTPFSPFQQKPKRSKSKYKRMRQRENEEMEEVIEDTATEVTEILLTSESVTLQEFAKLAKKTLQDIMTVLLKNGMMITLNQNIDIPTAEKIGEWLGIPVRLDMSDKEDSKIKYDLHFLESAEKEDTTENLIERPPIVTIMGHVDHGKTKLLDTIRSSRIVEGEAGGITQHIGAYQVSVKGKRITFLDTPGHEAFTALRARGAQVTDIVILVVAANDGIMPQTIEAIDHAKAAGVPIIVAINKIDLPDANPDRILQQLTEHELVPEEWGGKTVICKISAKQKIGIDTLLEMVLLTAEMENLKANPDKKAEGIIIEAKLSKQRGPVATVLIKAGTLHKGDAYVIGTTYGRVRAMFNDLGKEVESSPPAYPIEILGITDVPKSGEIFQVMASEREARQLAESRAAEQNNQVKRKTTLAMLSKQLNAAEMKTLNIVIKADVQGSLEALHTSIEKIHNEHVYIKVIHSGTGVVNESDVMLAKASEAIILAFTVGAQSEAENLATQEGVEIRVYNIIYKLLEDLELAITGMLEPEYEDVIIGKAEVRSLFKSSKSGVIAGSFVTEGVMKKNANKVILSRGNKVLIESKFSSLKRFKDDVKEVLNNFDFGFTLEKFSDYKEGDTITVLETREKPRSVKK